MRARNIKPDFFRDAELSEVTIEARYLFIGLWCLADREGKLRDKPKQIRFEVFPETKTKDDIGTLLKLLVEHNLIIRYEVGNNKYIKVVNFLKHQSPHHTEKASDIPEPTVSHGELPLSSVNIPLNPDLLNPDILIPEKEALSAEPTTPPCLSPKEISDIWNQSAPAYLPRVTSMSDKRTKKLKRHINGKSDPDWWRQLFTDIDLSPFYSGKDGKWSGMDFDWAVIKHEHLRQKLDRTPNSGGDKAWYE
jgi:hypothetical protein